MCHWALAQARSSSRRCIALGPRAHSPRSKPSSRGAIWRASLRGRATMRPPGQRHAPRLRQLLVQPRPKRQGRPPARTPAPLSRCAHRVPAAGFVAPPASGFGDERRRMAQHGNMARRAGRVAQPAVAAGNPWAASRACAWGWTATARSACSPRSGLEAAAPGERASQVHGADQCCTQRAAEPRPGLVACCRGPHSPLQRSATRAATRDSAACCPVLLLGLIRGLRKRLRGRKRP